MIGAGSFARGTLAPGLQAAGMQASAVVSASGLSAESMRQRFGFESAHADPDDILNRDDLDLIVIATRHDSHARLAAAALTAGVSVYVEKPLALDWQELSAVIDAQRSSGAALFVGFNRRFAPFATELRGLRGPKLMAYRVNAGLLGPNHWLNDLSIGGGRLKGEGCHFIDFLCDQAAGDPVSVSAHGFPSEAGLALVSTDNFSVQVVFSDDSVGTLNYGANAPSGPGKERFEVIAQDAYGVIEDFKTAEVWRTRDKRKLGGRRQDKGFGAQFRFVHDVVAGRHAPPAPESYFLSTIATLAAARSLETGEPEPVLEAPSPRS